MTDTWNWSSTDTTSGVGGWGFEDTTSTVSGGTEFGQQVWVSPTKSVSFDKATGDGTWMHRDSPAMFAQFQKLALRAGFSDDIDTVTGLYFNAIKWASQPEKYANKMTVLDYFLGLPPSGNQGVGTTTSTQVNRRTYSESESAAVLNDTFRQTLGREATGEEIAAYMKAVNKMFAAEPSTTTSTTTTTREGANTRSSTGSTSKGGFDPTQFTLDYARARPEYAETYAATSFMSVLDNMVNGASSLGNPMGQ